MLRNVGGTILAPGAVDPAVPEAFRTQVGYGDLITAFLALLAVAALRLRVRGAIALVWLCLIVGLLEHGGRDHPIRALQGVHLPAPSELGDRQSRARQKISAAHIPYRIPATEELPTRLSGVLGVLYLMFNEGYLSSRATDRRLRARPRARTPPSRRSCWSA